MSAPAVLEHSFTPIGSAKDAFECRAPELLLSGPAGTGKSRALLEKLHTMALFNPGMRGLIIRKTQISLTNTALITFREHVARESLLAGHCTWYGGSAQESAGYRYANGSLINVAGMDNSTKIMSSEYDVAYVQEAVELTEGDWEAITSRLRNGKISFQQLMADTNPDTETHWLKRRAARGDTVLLESRHEHNPTLWDAGAQEWTERGRAYMATLDRLTGVRRLRLRDGQWASAEGIIWDGWDSALHLVDRFTIPDTWARYWSIDFGYRNPMVVQFWAEDGEGRLYLYRELYQTQTLVEDMAKSILSIVAPGGVWKEPKPTAIVCDHDAEDRATLRRHLGLSTTAAKKTVSDGLQAVASRLVPDTDGKPRLMLLRDSVVKRDPVLDEAKRPQCTAEEIPGYIWDTGAGKAPKEQPLKDNDHGCDAMRYLVMHRDLGGRPRADRWFG